MSEALKFSRLGFRCCRSPRDPSLRSFAEEKQTFPDGTTIKMNEFFSESEAQENWKNHGDFHFSTPLAHAQH